MIFMFDLLPNVFIIINTGMRNEPFLLRREWTVVFFSLPLLSFSHLRLMLLTLLGSSSRPQDKPISASSLCPTSPQRLIDIRNPPQRKSAYRIEYHPCTIVQIGHPDRVSLIPVINLGAIRQVQLAQFMPAHQSRGLPPTTPASTAPNTTRKSRVRCPKHLH